MASAAIQAAITGIPSRFANSRNSCCLPLFTIPLPARIPGRSASLSFFIITAISEGLADGDVIVS